MNTTDRLSLAIAIAAIFLSGTAIAAPLTNGGFESGVFTPWTTTSSGATVAGTTSGVAPVEGTFQAVMNTPNNGTVFQAPMETFLGLAANTLNQYNTPNGVGGGTAFKQTFDITAGQAITFRWDFLPNGNTTTTGQNDTAFFTIHLAGDTSSAIVFTLSSTAAAGGSATGYQTFTTNVLPAGSYLLGFAAYDQKTPAGAFNAQRPTLLIDGVAAVPEPATISFLAFGLVAGGACLIRRRRS